MLSSNCKACTLCDDKKFFSSQVLERHVQRMHRPKEQSTMDKLVALKEKAIDFVKNTPKMSRRDTLQLLIERVADWTKEDEEQEFLMLHFKAVVGPTVIREQRRGRKQTAEGRVVKKKESEGVARKKRDAAKIPQDAAKKKKKDAAVLLHCFRVFKQGEKIFVKHSNNV